MAEPGFITLSGWRLGNNGIYPVTVDYPLSAIENLAERIVDNTLLETNYKERDDADVASNLFGAPATPSKGVSLERKYKVTRRIIDIEKTMEVIIGFLESDDNIGDPNGRIENRQEKVATMLILKKCFDFAAPIRRDKYVIKPIEVSKTNTASNNGADGIDITEDMKMEVLSMIQSPRTFEMFNLVNTQRYVTAFPYQNYAVELPYQCFQMALRDLKTVKSRVRRQQLFNIIRRALGSEPLIIDDLYIWTDIDAEVADILVVEIVNVKKFYLRTYIQLISNLSCCGRTDLLQRYLDIGIISLHDVREYFSEKVIVPVFIADNYRHFIDEYGLSQNLGGFVRVNRFIDFNHFVVNYPSRELPTLSLYQAIVSGNFSPYFNAQLLLAAASKGFIKNKLVLNSYDVTAISYRTWLSLRELPLEKKKILSQYIEPSPQWDYCLWDRPFTDNPGFDVHQDNMMKSLIDRGLDADQYPNHINAGTFGNLISEIPPYSIAIDDNIVTIEKGYHSYSIKILREIGGKYYNIPTDGIEVDDPRPLSAKLIISYLAQVSTEVLSNIPLLDLVNYITLYHHDISDITVYFSILSKFAEQIRLLSRNISFNGRYLLTLPMFNR